ncbi:hypothetical protein AMTR_s00033p00213100 [Amborella trichopoda]|uniref:Kinesin motor domain-containing protein n=2 Tax=Amborella trichopoda TaxID=13333 RepID=U5D1W0_AMBTC|nr:hypothetical protein AMTR_s00033p00213100 [Amborella trichopoda]
MEGDHCRSFSGNVEADYPSDFHDNLDPVSCLSSTNQYDWEEKMKERGSPLSMNNRFFGKTDYGVMDSGESTLCVAGSRFVDSGFRRQDCRVNYVVFVNCGGALLPINDNGLNISEDTYFQGGDIIRTEESITNAGHYPCIYQSARYGNFSYKFTNLEPGDYFLDLHFAEIINTYGPSGMRVFDVFIQEKKVLCRLDIYSRVGANTALQLVDVRGTVLQNRDLVIRFEGINGSPVVSGICIRTAPQLMEPLRESEYPVCNICAAKIEGGSTKINENGFKSIVKYEKRIEELMNECRLKTDECYEAWLALTAANDKLEMLRINLNNNSSRAESLGETVDKQSSELKSVLEKYEHDRKYWIVAVNYLKEKMLVMKREHAHLSQEAHLCASSIPELNKMMSSVQTLVSQCEDLKMKYNKEQAERKELYNKVLEMKGNIRVFCRCRPMSKEELSSGSAMVVDFDSAKDGELGIHVGGSSKRIFKFDRVYTPKDDQVHVFGDASSFVVSVLDGYNVCIFAYGQTGTGKTFTMEGTEHNRGVNYRTLEELFRIARERKDMFHYDISVSVLEVYNEQIRDLLATVPASKKLEIKQAGEGVHHVPGLVEAQVNNSSEVWTVLQAGSSARAVGSNNVNEHSSRSHCMLCIMVRSKNLMSGECTNSKLWLVDLAGSERLGKTEAQGERLKEAQNINKSLSALGDVINALATKSSHVPYRNSKLTHLLQDSLGGDSKTLMFVQISPCEKDSGETLSSLNFATRVRGVELGPAKKQIDTTELQKLKLMLEKSRQESRFKEETLKKLEDNCQALEAKLRGKDQQCRSYQEKVKELEGILESKVESHSRSERESQQLVEKLIEREETCRTLQLKVKELENALKEKQEELSKVEKVKELENALKEKHEELSKVESLRLSSSTTKSMPPISSKPEFSDHYPVETESLILQCSNSINRPTASSLLRGQESLQKIAKARESKNHFIDPENTSLSSTSLERKPVLDTNRTRQIDSSKAFGRLTRTSKIGAQRSSIVNRAQRATVALKERDKTRGWTRSSEIVFTLKFGEIEGGIEGSS